MLAISNVRDQNAGGYSVVVSNLAGSTVSELAALTVEQVISEVQIGTSGFQFRLNVPAGKAATVQSSTDLVNWEAVTPPLIGITIYQDVQPTNLKSRFFRVLLTDSSN